MRYKWDKWERTQNGNAYKPPGFEPRSIAIDFDEKVNFASK